MSLDEENAEEERKRAKKIRLMKKLKLAMDKMKKDKSKRRIVATTEDEKDEKKSSLSTAKFDAAGKKSNTIEDKSIKVGNAPDSTNSTITLRNVTAIHLFPSKTSTMRRPCPLSKRRKLEPEVNQATVREKSTEAPSFVPSLPTSNSCNTPANIVETKPVKRFVGPCPRSRKPKFHVENTHLPEEKNTQVKNVAIGNEKPDDKVASVVSPERLPPTSPCPGEKIASIQKTEKKNISRPCPRSKKGDFSKTPKKNEIMTEENSAKSNATIISSTFPSAIFPESESDCDSLSKTHVQNELKIRAQTETPIMQQSVIPGSTSDEQVLEAKWKDAICKLQSEIGTPENLTILADMFSTKKLLNLQHTLNSNKPLYLFELILPHIWMDLNLQSLLQCRLVCGRWANAVDKLLDKRTIASDDDDKDDFSTNRCFSPFKRNMFIDQYNKQRFSCLLISIEKVQTVHEQIRNHSRNPFVTRSVLVRASPELNEEEFSKFWTCVRELFRAFGVYIWHLQLDIQGYHSSRNTYKTIQRVLKLVPNLRKLELLCHSIDKFHDFSELRVQKSLPNLPYLQHLDLNGAKCPNSFGALFIEQYGKTLKNLRVSLYRWNEKDTAALTTNLGELDIIAMCSHENLSHLYTPLESLQHLYTLRKISLTVIVTLKTSKLFGILQHFRGLCTIKIILLEHAGEQMHLQDDLTDINESPPCLPNVRSVELSLTSYQKSFRFFKWFPSLSSLHLAVKHTFCDGEDDPTKKAIQDRIFRSIKRCILRQSAVQSSVWSLLPSLQILTVAITDLNVKKNDFCFVRDMCYN